MSDLSVLGVGLPDIWFALVFFLFAMFLLLDGFDFGVGVLFAAADSEEREHLLAAIGPFWDGNEVWLVVFGGALFAAFPEAYATLFSRYYLLMFGILAALALRGLAPELYEQRDSQRWHEFWGASFVVGSTATPILLGVFVTNWLLGATAIVTVTGVVGGLALLALTVVDGIAFLGLKTPSLSESVRPYARYAIVAYLGFAVLLLAALAVDDPALADALFTPIPLVLVLLTVVLGVAYAVAVDRRRYREAFVATAGLVFGLATLVAVLMFPYVDRATGLTVADAIVSDLPLSLMSVMMGIFLPLVLLYFVALYSAFRGPMGETY